MAYDVSEITLGSTNTISYTEAGEKDNLCVLFVHGNGFSKEVFKQQFASEKLGNLRKIAVDLPGHGNSSNAVNPAETYSYSGFADEMIGFLEEMKISECVVAGWSLGGQVALEMIDQSPIVKGVCAFGAPPAPNGPLGLIRSMKFCRTLLLAGKAKFSDQEAKYFEKMSFGEFSNEEYQEQLLRADPEMRPNLSQSVMKPAGISQLERFKASTIPVCLIHGAKEPLIRGSYMKGLSSPMLFGEKTAIIDDAGHAPFVQTQSEFDNLLSGFCDWVQSEEFSGHNFVQERNVKYG